MNKIGFIGTGNLASSIVKGLRRKETDYEIYLYDVFKEKAESLAERYNAQNCSLAEVVHESQILVLAVKPKDIKDLLRDLSVYPLKGKLIITVAAGIGLAVYEHMLPGIGIIRVMPNTSGAVLQAVSGMARGKEVSDEQTIFAENIFSAIGKVLWINESNINALTAVSGSGPAYFYLFTELMTEAGVKLGLTKEEAEFLARETFVGVGRMLEEDSRSPQELRKTVTSPNGTTEAAINSFKEQGLDKILYSAMLACLQRAEQMEREYSQ